MAEYWDIYDENRQLTGRKHRRGDVLQTGEYHLVVHICMFNRKGELLIQKRHSSKRSWSGMWDLSAAGAALAGETSREAAEREVEEELGITIELAHKRPVLTFQFEQGFDDFWLIDNESDCSQLTLQKKEVQAVKWVTKQQIMTLIKQGEMIPYSFINQLFEWHQSNQSLYKRMP
ncbi:NUDIX hydrolase [Listeria ilorinensis]|uniref:NUDIX hydrolase n=1 Tax=Listeria ilorinensis TaxID=2867439 RepID=UPI001EF6BD1A|nr:NUDIX domain-containing protein [Listeria ilorinensis]